MNKKPRQILPFPLPYVLSVSNDDFSIRIVCSRVMHTGEEDMRTRRHLHDFFEMIYVISGEMSVSVGEKTYNIGERSYIIYPPGLEHQNLHISPGTARYGFSFEIDNLSEKYGISADKLNNFLGVWCATERINLLICLICCYLDDGMAVDDTVLVTLMELLFRNLFEQITVGERETVTDTSVIRQDDTNQSIISNMNRYIMFHIEENITVHEVARAVGFSPQHLNRLLKKYCNCSVKEVIDEAKCKQIEQLLCQENISLTEIAEQLGFTKLSTMTIFYKRMTGKSPIEFRKQNVI